MSESEGESKSESDSELERERLSERRCSDNELSAARSSIVLSVAAPPMSYPQPEVHLFDLPPL